MPLEACVPVILGMVYSLARPSPSCFHRPCAILVVMSNLPSPESQFLDIQIAGIALSYCQQLSHPLCSRKYERGFPLVTLNKEEWLCWIQCNELDYNCTYYYLLLLIYIIFFCEFVESYSSAMFTELIILAMYIPKYLTIVWTVELIFLYFHIGVFCEQCSITSSNNNFCPSDCTKHSYMLMLL